MTKVFFFELSFAMSPTEQQEYATKMQQVLSKASGEFVEVVVVGEGTHFIDKEKLMEMLQKK